MELKKIMVVCVLITLLVTMGSPTCLAAAVSPGYEFQTAEESEAYIKRNVFFKRMEFEGGNRNWQVSLVVSRTWDSSYGYKPYIQLTLTPKHLDFARLSYSIISDNAYITDSIMQINKQPIEIKSYRMLPRVGEDIVVCIQSSASTHMDVLLLKQVIPNNIKITPEKAIQIFVNEYHAIFGKFPAQKFSYEMEIYNDRDWIVSFEDNDGIGGWALLLIDGRTGQPGDMKIEE